MFFTNITLSTHHALYKYDALYRHHALYTSFKDITVPTDATVPKVPPLLVHPPYRPSSLIHIHESADHLSVLLV